MYLRIWTPFGSLALEILWDRLCIVLRDTDMFKHVLLSKSNGLGIHRLLK